MGFTGKQIHWKSYYSDDILGIGFVIYTGYKKMLLWYEYDRTIQNEWLFIFDRVDV